MGRYKVSRKGYSHYEHCCKYCGEKDPENFYGKKKLECKKCFNKNLYKKRKDIQQEARDLLGGNCSRCGYDKCQSALEFHHKDPTKKDFVIGGNSLSRDKILKEAAKCILLCANCHREVHEEIRLLNE